MNQEEQKTTDPGKETLNIISSANKFNAWMFDTIRHFIHGNVLEIGSGIGNISVFLLNNFNNCTLSDIRQDYCTLHNNNFSTHPSFKSTISIDIVHPDFKNVYQKYLGTFDTVFALNVLEHITDDYLAINNCRKLLKPQGTLIILVPAYKMLYSGFDKELGHIRRYTKKSITKVFLSNGLLVKKVFYFNFSGIFGWFFSGKILRKKVIPSTQMQFYNKLVPVFKVIDKLIFNSIGLSLIIVGENQ